MKTRLLQYLCGGFLVLLFGAMVGFNHHKPRIMILHTYSESGAWDKAVDNGIRLELSRNLIPVSTRWHYMAFTNEPARIQWDLTGKASQRVVDYYAPDVLIAIGEEAQEYVGRHYAGRQDLRIVYGMGENPVNFGYEHSPNVTGINEVLPLREIVDALAHLGRPSLRIRALGMNDATGHAESQQVLNFSWAPYRLMGVQLVEDYQEWQEAVRAAEHDCDVLIILSFTGLPLSADIDRAVGNPQIAAWTENESVPLAIGVRESFVQGGGALAIVPSAQGMGQLLARKALSVLAAPKGGPIPAVEDNVEFQIAMRPGRLAERKVSLPAIYTQAARTSHSLYE